MVLEESKKAIEEKIECFLLSIIKAKDLLFALKLINGTLQHNLYK